jgi:hypothetical protein
MRPVETIVCAAQVSQQFPIARSLTRPSAGQSPYRHELVDRERDCLLFRTSPYQSSSRRLQEPNYCLQGTVGGVSKPAVNPDHPPFGQADQDRAVFVNDDGQLDSEEL